MELAELKARLLELLRTDEEFRLAVAGLIGLDEILKAIRALQEQAAENIAAIRELREDMNEGFKLLRRHIDALGARWGLLAENAFREAMTGVVERYFGGSVKR